MFCYQRSQAQRVPMEIDDQVCPNKKCEIYEGFIRFHWYCLISFSNASGTAIRTGILSSEFDEPIEDFAPTWPNYNMDGQQYMAIGEKERTKD